MQRRNRRQRMGLIGLVVLLIGLFTACGGPSQSTHTQTPDTAEPFANETALYKAYSRIVVSPYDANEAVKTDYPQALDDSHAALMAALIKQGRFEQIDKDLKGAPEGCLIVQTRVPEMRIVSGAARLWGGAFAGNSSMVLDLKLVDAQTQTVVREKRIESSNNAFAAAWTYGSSDRSLPADMGNIAAQYLFKVVPTP